MKQIYIFDIMKFIFSFFVIALHTLYLIPNYFQDIRILIVIFHLAVPVFFIISGYLLFRKIEIPLNKKGEEIIFKYLKHILFLYLLWTLIYLPINIYGAVIEGVSVFDFFKYTIRKLLFVGESYYSWNLWYLHGLLLAVIMVYTLLKCKIKPKYIVVFGIVIFGFGILLDQILGNTQFINSLPIFVKKLLNLYQWLFERVRNGIFKGFPYVAIGMLVAHRKTKISWKYSFLLFVTGMIFYYCNIQFGLLIYATGFFLCLLCIPIKSCKKAEYFRKSSLLIYLLHMIFVFLYVEIIKDGNVYQPIHLFLFVSICCI